MTDRARLLVADLERIPEILREHAAAGPPNLGSVPPDGRSAPLDGRSGQPRRADSPVGRLRRPRRVVLTGLGSSRFAALAIAPTLRDAGLEVVVEHASSSRPAPVGAGTLVVAISSSGRTPETVAAASRARVAGASVLAITNRPDAALAEGAMAVFLLGAGDESSGVASATYAATVAALIRLAEALGGKVDASSVLAEAAGAADEVLAGRGRWLGPAADLLDGGAPIHVLADAAALGTAEQAALLFREGPRMDADATDAGDWLHVGIYTVLPGYRAILLAGTPYDAEIIGTIHGRCGRVVVIGAPVTASPASPDTARAQARALAPATAPAAAPSGPADLQVPLPAGALSDPLVRALTEPIVTSSLAAELWKRARASDR